VTSREPLRRRQRASVFRGEELVGSIERTDKGSLFRYAPAFQRAHTTGRGIAYNLACRAEPYETLGVNLHTFFAGLLPEGYRLNALVRSAKTSPDDLLTLLMAAGSDTIGDVCVVPEGETPKEVTPTADVATPEALSFPELFERSIQYGSRGHAEIVVPGVQEKISAGSAAAPNGKGRSKSKRFILKLNPPELPRLVENEFFFMTLAEKCGIEVPATRLLRDREGNVALLVERFDRIVVEPGHAPVRVHQEEACQILDRYPADKYNLDCSEVASSFELCSAPIVELAKFLRLVAYAYVICNGDLHGKNISLRTAPSGRIEMTEAYDLVSTLPYGDRSMALAFEQREDNLKRKLFIQFGERFGVRKQATEAILDEVSASVRPALATLRGIGLEERETRHLESTMKKRLADVS
jgi:serine/threonine-protein kinase HipA